MNAALPNDLSPNAMLVASLILVFLLLVVFFRKSVLADRLTAAAEKRAQAQDARVAALEEQLGRPESEATPDDVIGLLGDLPRALRVPQNATCGREIGEALGAGLDRTIDPDQWMVFFDDEGAGKQFTLVAAGSQSGGTWPVGACLTPQMGRVGLSIRRKKPMDHTDYLAEPPIVRGQVEESEPKAFAVDHSIPVLVKDRVVGAIAVGGSKASSHVTRAVLQIFADRASLLHRLLAARNLAARLENLDDVTGLHNRNWFTAQGSELIFRNREQLVSITCAVFGVDDFRIYAAREGPSKSQKLLRQVANLMREDFREGDLVCRWTEEEFAVLLPNVDRSAACELLDGIRRRVAAEPFEGAETQPEGAVTLSVGVACAPDDGQTFDALMDHAYRAFQTSRKRGGDRTSGEVEIDDEFLDVMSGLAESVPMRSPDDV